MQQERRRAPRTRLPDASVVYESTRHEPRDAELLDIGTGGLFIPAVTPLPRGTRLVMEICLGRGGPPWGALGRVTWTRARPIAGRPSGMGIKIVDIDEAAVAAIERAIGPAAPARERTVRGIGTLTPPAVWVAKGPAMKRRGTRRGRATAMAAALLIAAVGAATLGAMQWRMRGTPWRAAPAETAAAQPPPAVPAETPPAVSAPAASADDTTPTQVVPLVPATTGKPASRPAPWRAWSATPKRPGAVSIH
jgi:hypothetical protein